MIPLKISRCLLAWSLAALLSPVTIFATESVVVEGAKPVKLASDFAFAEGPSADAAGNVFFTDQPHDRIMRFGIDGKITEWLKPAGRSNGTHFDRHGLLLTCADEHNQLWSIAPDKTVTVLVKDFGGKLLNGPNDLWITPDNNIYFTDPLYKREYWTRDATRQQPGEYVYFINRKTGNVSVADPGYKKPNGIVGTPDGKKLYVSDIGDRKTYSYQIAEDGSLTNKQLFCQLGSDGMTIDNEGNVYLTGKGVTVFNSKGEQIDHIDIVEPWTSNLTFCGVDRHELFITASKSVYLVQMRVSGVVLETRP